MPTSKTHLSACLALCLSATTPSFAQDAGTHLQPTADQFGMQAGFRFSMPLGATAGERFDTRAKLQLTLSATRVREFNGSNIRTVRSQDMLAIGLDQAFQPRLSLHGQDFSRLAFPATYANDEDLDVETVETATGSKGTGALLVLGGIVLVGGVLYVAGNELEDDVSDGIRCVITDLIGPGDCKT